MEQLCPTLQRPLGLQQNPISEALSLQVGEGLGLRIGLGLGLGLGLGSCN